MIFLRNNAEASSALEELDAKPIKVRWMHNFKPLAKTRHQHRTVLCSCQYPTLQRAQEIEQSQLVTQSG